MKKFCDNELKVSKTYIFALFSFFLYSCGQENPVPAYLHIPAFSLSTKANEGTAAHKITDAWVYIDGQINGVFQLPVTIPVVELGQREIRIFPGIRNNGTRSNPIIYPLLNSYVVKKELMAGKIDTIKPTTTYISTAQFKMMEDFELSNIFKIDRDGKTDVQFTTTPNGFEGKGAQITLSKNTTIAIEKATTTKVELSETAENIFIEMHYKTEAPLSVGILGSNTANPNGIPSYKIILFPNKDWNKTYLNITNEVKDLKMTNFQLLLNSLLPDTLTTATILIDNIKLIQK